MFAISASCMVILGESTDTAIVMTMESPAAAYSPQAAESIQTLH
jgi:hypothetical protein